MYTARRDKIEAKNGLENYAYSMRNSINDEKMKVCPYFIFSFCICALGLLLNDIMEPKDKLEAEVRALL